MNLMLNFYNEYLDKIDLETNKAELFKQKYLKSIIKNEKYIYKFYSFDTNTNLNFSKLKTFENNKIWFSPYYCFNDPSEFCINYDLEIASNKANIKKEVIKNFVEIIKQINDLSSFTTDMNDRMWKEYANNYKGFCVKYEILDFESFYPIIYADKNALDFTNTIIENFYNRNRLSLMSFIKSLPFKKLSILPVVLKDFSKYGFEHEIRCLYDNDFRTINSTCLKGRVYPNCKQEKEYKGSAIDINKIGLKISEVVIPITCSYREEILNICKNNNYKAQQI